jgi:hypothetical protein
MLFVVPFSEFFVCVEARRAFGGGCGSREQHGAGQQEPRRDGKTNQPGSKCKEQQMEISVKFILHLYLSRFVGKHSTVSNKPATLLSCILICQMNLIDNRIFPCCPAAVARAEFPR